MSKVTKAVIPAAGFGTRFLPATKAIPKEMFPIIDKPTIQFIVEEAIASGISDILIIVSSNKNTILDHFDYNFELEKKLLDKNKNKEYDLIHNIADNVRIQYVRQKQALGLGHAILLAEQFVNDEPFAVLLGDDIVITNNKQKPALRQCIEAYDKVKSSIVGVQEVPLPDVVKYGIIKPIDSEKKDIFMLDDIVEKPSVNQAPSQYAVLGRYVLSPGIFQELKQTKIDKNSEIQLTNAISSLLKKEKVYAKSFVGERFDIGSKIGYIKAFIYLSYIDNELRDEISKFVKKFF